LLHKLLALVQSPLNDICSNFAWLEKSQLAFELTVVELSITVSIIPFAELQSWIIVAVAVALRVGDILLVVPTKGVAEGLREVVFLGAGFCTD
jgi:hypothetical protein